MQSSETEKITVKSHSRCERCPRYCTVNRLAAVIGVKNSYFRQALFGFGAKMLPKREHFCIFPRHPLLFCGSVYRFCRDKICTRLDKIRHQHVSNFHRSLDGDGSYNFHRIKQRTFGDRAVGTHREQLIVGADYAHCRGQRPFWRRQLFDRISYPAFAGVALDVCNRFPVVRKRCRQLAPHRANNTGKFLYICHIRTVRRRKLYRACSGIVLSIGFVFVCVVVFARAKLVSLAATS